MHSVAVVATARLKPAGSEPGPGGLEVSFRGNVRTHGPGHEQSYSAFGCRYHPAKKYIEHPP